MDQVSPPAVPADEVSLPKSRSTFTQLPFWVPHALTAALMLVIVLQIVHIFTLNSQIHAMNDMLVRESDSLAMISLRLNSFEARDPAYQAARIAVAWDATQHQGVITAQNLPAPAAGYNYQLWVLDPGALTPFNAGLIHTEKPSSIFKVPALSTVSPGFAISLEPAGGSPEPTGSILFAVEPGQ
jgi:anti-sigma-K factor RskA